MKKILIFQHVPFEILGTLNPLIKSKKYRIKYVNFGRKPHDVPSIEGYNRLIVLGGPMSAYEFDKYPHLETEVRLIKYAITKGIPILGICLGAQLLSLALGGTVSPNKVKEIGWYDVNLTEDGKNDRLLKYFKPEQKIFQWHGDTFTIPEDAIKLASSKYCENQAFRYGDKIYGFQFHLEANKPLIERWLNMPEHQMELQECEQFMSIDRINSETIEYSQELKHLSEQVFHEFIKLV